MRTITLIIFCLTLGSATSQSLITDYDTIVWKYRNSGTYDHIEWATEADEDKFYKDTIYAIQFFPKKNDWKVYFDASKTKVATLVHFDAAKKTINTKHFNRQGKLIKELEAKYFNSKKYNPAFIDVKNVVYLKAYQSDSLVCEIQGFNTSLLHKYKNPFTKRHFEKRVYYKDGQYHADEIGETIWEYHENGIIKSICSTYINVENDKEGNQISTEVFNCNQFDKSGCLIKTQPKQADTDK